MEYVTLIDSELNPVENKSGILLASAARTVATSSADIKNLTGKGLFVHFKTTAGTAGYSVVLKIEGKNAAGVYYTLLEGAAVTGTSDNLYSVAPWAAEVANVSTTKMVPRELRVTVTPADNKSVTYGVYYDLC
jgi:hypothetical protein